MNGFYTLYHIVSCWLILYGIWPCNFWGYPIWTWVILVRKGRTHKSKMLRALVLISGEKNLDSFFAYFADGRRFNRLYIDRYSYYMFNMSRDFSAVTERTYHPAWWACRLAAHPQRMTSCRLRLMAQIDEEEQISFKDPCDVLPAKAVTFTCRMMSNDAVALALMFHDVLHPAPENEQQFHPWQEEQHKVELQAKLSQMEMKMVQGKQARAEGQKGDDDLLHFAALHDFCADRYGLHIVNIHINHYQYLSMYSMIFIHESIYT